MWKRKVVKVAVKSFDALPRDRVRGHIPLGGDPALGDRVEIKLIPHLHPS